MRQTCKALKLGITHELENMRQLITQEVENTQAQLAPMLREDVLRSQQQVKEKRTKPKETIGKVEVKRVR